jgi:hypothetical protein
MPTIKKKVLPDIYTFILAGIAGVVLGGILSWIFSYFKISGKIPFEYTIGGYPIGLIMTEIILVAAIAAIVFMSYVAFLVRDNAFPSEHPFLFTLETLCVGFIPATIIYIMSGLRTEGKLDIPQVNREFLLLGGKFAIFHLLFQFSGLYSYFFRGT